MSRTEDLLKTLFKPIPPKIDQQAIIKELKKEITRLKKESIIRKQDLERELLWRIKMKQAGAPGRSGEKKCVWCRKFVDKSEITVIEGLGNFCKDCAEKKKSMHKGKL